MSWNHRVLVTEHKHADGEVETWLSIHEVYYDEDVKPNGPTERPIAVCGNSKKELKWTLKQIKKSISKPFLWGDDRFPEEYKKE